MANTAPEELKIAVTRTPGGALIEVEGEIDIYSCPPFREWIDRLIREGRYQIIVGLEKVPYIDSQGIGVLIGALRQVTEPKDRQGSIELLMPNPRVLKALEICGLSLKFGTYQDRAKAMAFLGPPEQAE